MKTFRSLNLTVLMLVALAWAIAPFLRAETPPAPAPAEQPAAPVSASKAEAAKPESTEKNAVAPVAPVDAATKAAAADVPPPASDDKKVEPAKSENDATPAKVESTKTKYKHGKSHHKTRHTGNARVGVFQDNTLAEDEQADSVVSILGSSTSAGEVSDSVVSILGSSTSSGNVSNAVVSILGNTRVTGGEVGDVAVAVLGNTYVNGRVNGPVVAVLGNVELGPDAVVGGEIVCIGGAVKRDPGAEVNGEIRNVAIAGHFLKFDWLNAWITKCVFYARPLAFDANVMWAWWIALACLGFYTLVALIAPQGVTKCVQTLEEKPGYSILSAILAMLLTPVAFLLLFLTVFVGIGVVLIPLFSLGLFFAALFGKVVILAWLGRRLTKLFGDGPLGHPAFAVLLGGVIVLLLYTVPVVGLIVYKLIGLLGLGVVLYTLLRSIKRNRPVAPTPVAATVAAVVPPLMGEIPVPAVSSTATPPTLPSIVSASTLPRVGFWLRLAASLLDLILISIVYGMLRRFMFGLGGAFPLWLAIYAVVMWATKGTTIGGIVCGLKVVRIDDRPLDWSVAIVRGLSAFLSLAVAGLGFIWVAFDDDKQSWHDKIAGTTIVKVPKGTPLL